MWIDIVLSPLMGGWYNHVVLLVKIIFCVIKCNFLPMVMLYKCISWGHQKYLIKKSLTCSTKFYIPLNLLCLSDVHILYLKCKYNELRCYTRNIVLSPLMEGQYTHAVLLVKIICVIKCNFLDLFTMCQVCRMHSRNTMELN